MFQKKKMKTMVMTKRAEKDVKKTKDAKVT